MSQDPSGEGADPATPRPSPGDPVTIDPGAQVAIHAQVTQRLRDELDRCRVSLAGAQARIAELEQTLQAIHRSPLWPLLDWRERGLRKLRSWRLPFSRPADTDTGPGDPVAPGQETEPGSALPAVARSIRDAGEHWQRTHQLARSVASADRQPGISVIIVDESGDTEAWRRTRESVLGQISPHRDLLILSADEAVRAMADADAANAGAITRLRYRYLADGSSIGRALGVAVKETAGEFVAIVPAGDEWLPGALLESMAALQATPPIDALYADQRVIDHRGSRIWRKPAWSPALLMSIAYVGGLLIVRADRAREFAEQADTLFPGCDQSAADWSFALMLRLGETIATVSHLPSVLLHSRIDPDRALQVSPDRVEAWINASLARQGIALGALTDPARPGRRILQARPGMAGQTERAAVAAKVIGLYAADQPAGLTAGAWLNRVLDTAPGGLVIGRSAGVAKPTPVEQLTLGAWCGDSRIGLLCGSPGHGSALMTTAQTNPLLESTHEVDAVAGGLFAIELAQWRNLGGFDEAMVSFAGAWIELSLRARERGHRNLQIAEVPVRIEGGDVLANDTAGPARSERSDRLDPLDALLIAERYRRLMPPDHPPPAPGVLLEQDDRAQESGGPP